MQQGSFSQTSILGRTKTPTSTSLRRLGSNLSSSSTTQSQQSKSSKPSTINYPNNNPFTAAASSGVSGVRRNSNTPTATKGILKNSQYSASFLQNGSGGFDDDTRSLAGKSTTSIVTATKSQTSLGNSPSKFGANSQRKSMSQQNNNNNSKFAPRVYLPGEEEIVVSKNVVDLSTAKSDIELLENDLGRSSLMMPKEMREKMLAMRSQMFSNNNENSSPSKNKSDYKDQQAETGNGSNSENPLPRGSQLLKRLQLSVDRSSNLMSELEDRSKSCESLLDQLIFAATKDERQQTKLEQKKKQAALAERLSAAGPGGVVAPSTASMGNSKIILSPSPQPKRSTPTASSNNNNSSAAKNSNKNTTYSSNLDDTFAALEYSASPPPRNAPSTSRQRQQLDNSDLVGLDDTFAGLSPI